jgi:hypothetical protein
MKNITEESPEQRALNRLRIALETGRWEFVQEAFGILDAATNTEPKPEPFRLPEKVRHMQKTN